MRKIMQKKVGNPTAEKKQLSQMNFLDFQKQTQFSSFKFYLVNDD